MKSSAQISYAKPGRSVLTMRYISLLALLVCVPLSPLLAADAKPDYAVVKIEPGTAGGRIATALRLEPKTFNPVLVVDATSREILNAIHADLIHINRQTQRTEPALAKSWTVSPDGRKYTLQLRHDLTFSDGSPFTADDVVFSFQVYLDPNVHSSQRDLLVIDDKPIVVRKTGPYSVEFELAKPYAAAERIFDGIAMLPRHVLEQPYREGKLGQTWGTNADPKQLVGMGAFRMKEYVPGQRLILERNPNYWKVDAKGNRLPYLAEVSLEFIPTEDAQLIRFQSGETQILERIGADNFATLQKDAKSRGQCMYDLGPGLEYVFLFFNLNHVDPAKSPDIAAKQEWFRDLRFRQAVSLALDRKGMARLAYGGRATPLWGQVTPGNKLWVNENLPHPGRSLDEARKLLQSAGFSWKSGGGLVDSHGRPVSFTLLVSSSNAPRTRLATIAQDDLKELGIDVQIVPLEFRALVDRLLNSKQYEAAIMNLVSGDVDPTSEMNVWPSSGETHLWDLGEAKASTPWETEIDRLMEAQLTTTDYQARKKLYDQVQTLVAQNLPFVFLASPNILVAASGSIGNFRPGILDPYALWNIEEFFLRPKGETSCR